jgi:adenosylcobinamide amidohydrolase
MQDNSSETLAATQDQCASSISGSLWETIDDSDDFRLERSGRYLKATLLSPHRVLSTSALNGGLQTCLRYLVNHQSCEARDHQERHELLKRLGLEGYHRAVCQELGVDPELTAVMGTAANMNYAGMAVCQDDGLQVTAVVTAGVQGNAACAGDPAQWRETGAGWEKINPLAGTINTMLFLNCPVTDGALARAVVTMTEAKSAALFRLSVGSLYSADLATGTGTDQYCIAVPAQGEPMLTSTSPHVKLGELIGVAVRDATLRALQWQNGLEASYTRGLYHCLGRYGLTEQTLYGQLATMLTERQLELFRRNEKAALYEPLVSAAAYAFTAVLDRVRYGTLPAGVAREAMRQQGACLAAALAAKTEQWQTFYHSLPTPDPDQPVPFLCAAIAQGWASKWS